MIATVNRMPTTDEWIQASLIGMRAACKTSVMFGPAGKAEIRSNGERVIYGPSGSIIGRVTEDPHGGTQIEQDDRLHAVVRPRQVQVLMRRRENGPPEVVSVNG